MKILDIIKVLEELAPLSLQESYDNAGLVTGNPEWDVRAALCSVDVTPEVMKEALKLKANLIVAHHPVIFSSLKSITGKTETERVLLEAIRKNIAIYCAHTNLDNAREGVNQIISNKLGLKNCAILKPATDLLFKLVTFVPEEYADKVRDAVFRAGAGHIGNYDSCSFNSQGEGTFRGNESTNPFVGQKGELHNEPEIRIETIVPEMHLKSVIDSMISAHPYEDVAYDIYPLKNIFPSVGSGMIGEFDTPVMHDEFLEQVRKTFGIPVIRYSGKPSAEYKRIALCGGSGSFLIGQAIRSRADAFLTSDLKYHQFFEADDKLLLCDIGHYESEQFTKEIFYSLLTKKFSTFAVHLSSIVTNPIKYYI